jgi:MraZ protein
MTAFIGDYTCKVDAKGRILLSSALLHQMAPEEKDRFVIKKDIYENCLLLYPIAEWEKQNALIMQKINPYKKEHNQFLREFYKGTAEVQLDSSNRILVPKRLLDLAGITNEVVLAGQYSKIEIWSKAVYEKIGSDENEISRLADKILGGINLQNDE